MKKKELKQLADKFLKEATDNLLKFSYDEIREWPEFPDNANVDLNIPKQLNKYHYGVIKDTQEDNTIRITIQRYRHYFLGFGEMTADGFFISKNGEHIRFTQEDIWEVT